MADINLKTETPDTSLPTTGFLFGADSQAAASPSVYTTQAVATTLLGSTTLSGATITADAPVLNMSQTWNNAAVTFTGLKFNAAGTSDANSAVSSLLMDLQVGEASRFNITKGGVLTLGASGPVFTPNYGGAGRLRITNNFYIGDGGSGGTAVLYLSLSTNPGSAVSDLFLTRRAAANLRFGAADAAAPVAQTLSVQSGTAGASATTVSISGTALTIAGTITGTIAIGHAVTGTGVTAGTLITAGSGSSWTVNNSQTVGPITAYFNSVGQNLTITGSQGSGPSAGGSIIFQVAPAGSAATTAQNALSTALTIDSTRTFTFGSQTQQLHHPTGGSLYFGDSLVNIFRVSRLAEYYVMLDASVTFGFAAPGGITSVPDTVLRRDDANTLALRNGATGQEFRVYDIYTSGSNYRRLTLGNGGGAGVIVSVNGAGTGNNGSLYLRASVNAGTIEFGTASTDRWRMDASGHFLAITDNTYDIGASGASRPRNVFVASQVNALYLVSAAAALNGNGGIYFGVTGTGAQIQATAVGVLALANYAGTDFSRLQFGGTTSSFPAIKRSSTTLQARLADDTAFASVQGKLTTDTAYTAGSIVPTGYLTLYDSTGTAYRVPCVV